MNPLAIAITLSGWLFLIAYIFYDYSGIEHLISPLYASGLFPRLLTAIVPICSTLIGYLINERDRLLGVTETLERKYYDLYENAPDGYHSIGPDGTILEVNNTWLRMLGYERDEVVEKMKLTDLLTDDGLKTFQDTFSEFKSKGSMENIEHDLKRNDGTLIPVLINATAIYDKWGNFLRSRSIARDNSARRSYENMLKRASQQWQTTFDAISDAVCLLDSEGRIQRCNIAMTKLMGKPFSEIIGCTWKHIHGASGSIPIEGPSIIVMQKTKRRETMVLPIDNRWFNVTVDPVLDEASNLVGSIHIIRDITEHKRAEEKLLSYQEQLRSLASQLSMTEEQERRRIAADLHDHIGQTLAYCKIKLGSLRESASTDLAESLDEIRKLIEQTIQYTRSLTFELSPPILYELGFEAAVEWLGEQFQKQHDIQFRFEDDGQPKPVDDKARILLFQAVRELLVNVVKHSQARNSSVYIRRDGNNIQITVEDDGIGFDTSKLDSYLKGSHGFGLFSIRERLNRIRGGLNIESETGKGTKATIIAPLKKD